MRVSREGMEETPQTTETTTPAPVTTLTSYGHLVALLRAKRSDIGASQADVDHVAGLTTGHVSKLEAGPNGSWGRHATIDTVILWAGALGYRLVLEPMERPPAFSRGLTARQAGIVTRRATRALPAS